MVEKSAYYLPNENIRRIIKESFPKEINCKLSKDAKELFQEILTEFICFVSSEAADSANKNNRKTILGSDILDSLNELGFEHYNEILKEYLNKIKQHHEYNFKKN